ncbi:MAG: L-threonylcarbamoyladenylate synthase [Saprospiraceae bacterium]
MPIGNDLAQAKTLLEQGQLVAIPTETVYGLAGNAWDEQAVLRIFETKNRPTFDPLIVHTCAVERIAAFAHVHEVAERLFEAFSPGPLTVLLEKKASIPDLVTSGLSRVAVRIPRHPLTLSLLEQLDFPLAAPSANPFGYISPTTAAHVADQLGNKIPYILDGGACGVGVESTIVGVDEGQVTIYRLGGLSVEEIAAVAGNVVVQVNQSSNPAAPGMLKSHYAPRKPLLLGSIESLLAQQPSTVSIGILSFQDDYTHDPRVVAQEILSPSGDTREAARRLFAAMRTLDVSAATVMLAAPLPEIGLGRAINDRLARAAVRE